MEILPKLIFIQSKQVSRSNSGPHLHYTEKLSSRRNFSIANWYETHLKREGKSLRSVGDMKGTPYCCGYPIMCHQPSYLTKVTPRCNTMIAIRFSVIGNKAFAVAKHSQLLKKTFKNCFLQIADNIDSNAAIKSETKPCNILGKTSRCILYKAFRRFI